MQTARQLARRRWQQMLALVVGIVVAVGGLMAIGHLTAGGSDEADAGDTPFAVIDGAHRELDGSPALAVSFSVPLEAKGDHERFLQVLEMPAEAKAAAARDGEADGEDGVGAATVAASGEPPHGQWRFAARRPAGCRRLGGRRQPSPALLPAHQAADPLRGPRATRFEGTQWQPARQRGAFLDSDGGRCPGVLLRQPWHGPAGGTGWRPAGDDGECARGGHPVPQGQGGSTAEVPRAGDCRPTGWSGRGAADADGDAAHDDQQSDGDDGHRYAGSRLRGAVGNWGWIRSTG